MLENLALGLASHVIPALSLVGEEEGQRLNFTANDSDRHDEMRKLEQKLCPCQLG